MSTNGEHKGMSRRPSASTSAIPVSISTSTTSTRVHRTNDSHYGFVGTHPTNAGPAAFTPATATGSPQSKAVLALIKRLTSKLPCYSGHSLADLESDSAMLNIIETLVELAKHALDIIVWKLSEELERLAKASCADTAGQRALDVLQSELFLLKVMSVTLSCRWQHRKQPGKSSQTFTDNAGSDNPDSIPSPAPSPSFGALPKSSKRSQPTSRFSTPSLSLEAPPLDENCARWLVSVMILLFRQAASRDDRSKAYDNLSSDVNLYGFESINSEDGLRHADDMPWMPPAESEPSPPITPGQGTRWPRKTPSLTSVSSSSTAPIPLARSALGYQRTPRTLISSSLPLYSLITEWAGHIVYLLSAANWSVVLAKIRNKIHQLARTTQDEFQDYTDLQLMQHCAMDRNRLVLILQELSSLLVNMKPEAQCIVAVHLRRAIWKWIETFPGEFTEMSSGQRKLDGAPERVFDLLIQIKNDQNRKILWPTLTALLLLSYDRLRQVALQFNGHAWNPKMTNKKELVFLDKLNKNLTASSKMTDSAMLCFVDILRAAMYIPPDHDVVVRSFAPDIADELKSRMLKAQNQRPFFESSEPIDVSLHADILVALVRFLAEDEYTSLIKACLEPDRSDAVKIVAVKALIIMGQQGAKWPYLPAIRTEFTKERIRRIFQSTVSHHNELDSLGVMRRSALKPALKRFSSEAIPDKELLVLAVMCLYRFDARFYPVEYDTSNGVEWLQDVTQLVRRPGDSAVPLSCLRTFMHEANWMFGQQPGDPAYELSRYWLSLSVPIVLQAAALRLLDARESLLDQRIMTEMVYYYMGLFKRCIESELIKDWDFSSGRLPAVIVAEMAFLVMLTSMDTTISALAAKGLREIAIAECLPNPYRPFEETDDAAKRYPVYEQLGDPSVVVVGRVAQQKRIRKLLRLLTRPCPLHTAVWHECYWRWAALRDRIARPPGSIESSAPDIQSSSKASGDLSLSPEERFYQWQNLTWFLASFGAVSITEEPGNNSLVNSMPAQFVPDRFRAPQDGRLMLNDFMSSTVESLLAELAIARDTAKEALGSELNPRLYDRLFKQLNEVVEDVARTANEPTSSPGEEELLLIFFEQYLTVLKLLVDRPDAPPEDLLTNMDLSQTLLTLTKFMDRFTDRDLLRLKIKFCTFCEVACARTDAFGIRKDDLVRNTLLNVIVEWIEPEGVGHDDFSLMRLRHEANVSALRTVVRLLERLRLQALDVSAGDDATHVVSRRYLRYQNVLLHGLRFDPLESTRKQQMGRDAGLRDIVISGLAHLLSTNTDIGLKHFLPLGYDSDSAKRTIFCRVITCVMDLGGRLETQNDFMVGGRRTRIGELVKGCDMSLVLAICETCPPSEVDVIIPVLLNLFDSRASLLDLLKLLIEREVKTTQNEVSLFRGNSMRIKLLCAFAKVHGYDYLRQLVKPLLDKMCDLTRSQSFILDPAKASEEEVRGNQRAVEVFTQAFLQIVCNSASGMPLMLREVCAHISQTVAEIWPEAKFAALGAFIFLRFISPALVSPETIDVELPQDHAALRRGLLVITKIIQNLANNVRFGKEAHMMCFNDFLSENIVRVMRFLTDVNKFASSVAEEEPDEWQGGTFDETDAIVLHRFFEKHADKVGKDLLSLNKTSKEGEAAVVGRKKAWDTLCAALVEMGQPVEVPRLSSSSSLNLDIYRDFMSRNADRNTGSVQDLFSQIAVKDDVLIYLLAICKFDIEVLDFELVVYHIFKTLSSPGNDTKSFELIIDCTNYTTASEIPMQWFKFFIELTPSDVRARLRTAHILNCNLPMQRFLRKLYNICSGIFFIEIRPKLSVAELDEALHCDVSTALHTAWTLEQEEKQVFRGVMLRQAHLLRVPVNLAVAQSHLRIDSVKPQNVYAQFSCKTTEIVPFGDIGDIYNVSTGRDANEFIIRRNRNGGTLYFSSPERDLIVKTIRTAKSRMNVSRSIFFDRFSRLSNVSAALLNIAMYNTHHESPDLRSAAYDLLAAVCSSINYNGASLLPSFGGFIPGRPMVVVTQLSEKLSVFAPELTLDFISQVCLELDKAASTQKGICLIYLNPWIKNFNKFCDPTNKLYELSGARLRDCIRLLLDLTVRDVEVCHIMARTTWVEMGKLDSVVINVILDEIMRAAVDGGIGSSRCEVMADVLSSMCSKNARGRILAKLRKALGKTSTKPSKTLDKNVHWNEITAYARLALGTGQSDEHYLQIQLLVPEILHLVTLLASQGDMTMRNTIYGLALQLIQSLYMMHLDDSNLSSEIRALLLELSLPKTICLFGLMQTSTGSEFVVLDSHNGRECLEGLARWLLRAVNICAGNTGLANVWRARWMGLLTATAFQLSPSIQPRAFVVMGTLASSDVDDDLLYQMLVALRSAMKTADESDTQCVVSMLNCVCNVVPSLPESSRYIGTLFWLAVALLQSSHAPFYKEANNLLCACITSLHNQGAFRERGFTATLLDARSSLEDISMQLDQLLGLSFDSDFSFSLAAVIFKGIRRPQLRESAVGALRCLITTAAGETPIHSDVLGYFLALLSVSTTAQSYQQLLQEARVGINWMPKKDSYNRFEDDNDQLPRVSFDVLGCQDFATALLAISFLGSILSSAQVDDTESQMLFTVLKEASLVFPDVVSLAYDGLQEKIHDIFTTSSNPSILSSASAIFRVAMEDAARSVAAKGSSSTLSTLDEDATYGQRQLHALEELGMQGLANTFQFLPLNRGHVTKVLNWFPELISKIIE
ncbi:hypothetical protein DFH11DRAFT_1839273 [Phellopilus nigrolimitatus]|nr:hypothetical protein DFH11DRAFT_1839273 [Phellopilus nigrolimitatus]